MNQLVYKKVFGHWDRFTMYQEGEYYFFFTKQSFVYFFYSNQCIFSFVKLPKKTEKNVYTNINQHLEYGFRTI